MFVEVFKKVFFFSLSLLVPRCPPAFLSLLLFSHFHSPTLLLFLQPSLPHRPFLIAFFLPLCSSSLVLSLSYFLILFLPLFSLPVSYPHPHSLLPPSIIIYPSFPHSLTFLSPYAPLPSLPLLPSISLIVSLSSFILSHLLSLFSLIVSLFSSLIPPHPLSLFFLNSPSSSHYIRPHPLALFSLILFFLMSPSSSLILSPLPFLS